MPIFEYLCSTCGHRFEAIVHGSTKPTCPACASEALDKQLSVFAVGSSAGRAASAPLGPAPCGRCGDPRGAGACSMN